MNAKTGQQAVIRYHVAGRSEDGNIFSMVRNGNTHNYLHMAENTITEYFENDEEFKFCLQSTDRHSKTFTFHARIEDD
jgi:hypothetical protein